MMTERSWIERKGFSDWGVALFWVVTAFIMFQIVGGVIAGIFFVVTSETIPTTQEILSNADQYLQYIFIGNSTGQILFLGLGTWIVTRLHIKKSERSSFLRLDKLGRWEVFGIAGLLMIAIQPSVWMLSWLNAQLPVPESIFELEQMQTDLIEKYLSGDHSLFLTLFHVSMVPAVCEEVLFRGYLLRTFENRWGAKAAILGSSLVFGFFHLRFMQVVPLVVIGLILGYITWSSESLYPAMLAHLINNGGSVIAVYAYPKSGFTEMSPETLPPLGLVLLSLVLSGYLLYLLSRKRIQFQTP